MTPLRRIGTSTTSYVVIVPAPNPIDTHHSKSYMASHLARQPLILVLSFQPRPPRIVVVSNTSQR